jgi:hypothetical protein
VTDSNHGRRAVGGTKWEADEAEYPTEREVVARVDDTRSVAYKSDKLSFAGFRPVVFKHGTIGVVRVLCGRRWRLAEGHARQDFGIIQRATLTLVALIIGFTFSMALNRYDQRKNYDEEEANAVGTEFARASLLAPTDAAKVRPLIAPLESF